MNPTTLSHSAKRIALKLFPLHESCCQLPAASCQLDKALRLLFIQ